MTPNPKSPAPRVKGVTQKRGALCGSILTQGPHPSALLHPLAALLHHSPTAGRRGLGPDAALGAGQFLPPAHTVGPCLHSARWVLGPKEGRQSCGRITAHSATSLQCPVSPFPASQPPRAGTPLLLSSLAAPLWAEGLGHLDPQLAQGGRCDTVGPGGRFREWHGCRLGVPSAGPGGPVGVAPGRGACN